MEAQFLFGCSHQTSKPLRIRELAFVKGIPWRDPSTCDAVSPHASLHLANIATLRDSPRLGRSHCSVGSSRLPIEIDLRRLCLVISGAMHRRSLKDPSLALATLLTVALSLASISTWASASVSGGAYGPVGGYGGVNYGAAQSARVTEAGRVAALDAAKQSQVAKQSQSQATAGSAEVAQATSNFGKLKYNQQVAQALASYIGTDRSRVTLTSVDSSVL